MFKVFFSIIFGISLGIIIVSIFKFSNRLHGPNSNIIVKNIYHDSSNDKYKLVPEKCDCPLKQKLAIYSFSSLFKKS